jgi:hypothetical protein
MRRPWRGRVRDRVWKAFTALAGETVPTGELVRRCWPRKSRFDFGLLPQAAGQIDGSTRSHHFRCTAYYRSGLQVHSDCPAQP